MAKNLYMLPEGLPEPQDDGACDHLQGMAIPSVALPSTRDEPVDLSAISGTAVVFFYPMTGKPEQPPMRGWNKIPGARGCTTQCCAFRDRYPEFQRLGVEVYGVSAQPLDDQRETVARLRLPYPLLNDSELKLVRALELPTFDYDHSRYIKRLTLLIEGGVVRQVYYPVFPPHLNPTDILAQLRS
ncbi:peroxiredoxin [Marinimicrobium sp. C6131]|uniref:peroxiredoxin n=1 Tax=Marinimicrobium sp. C6131 TaxID=3022676 RepID=UPI00223E2C66|nr:peroxiredoxin [Marinimicrobium sp. C6131]UZJ43849.1 peroxiredoxin [Marinimicrobium sp. C6131]